MKTPYHIFLNPVSFVFTSDNSYHILKSRNVARLVFFLVTFTIYFMPNNYVCLAFEDPLPSIEHGKPL